MAASQLLFAAPPVAGAPYDPEATRQIRPTEIVKGEQDEMPTTNLSPSKAVNLLLSEPMD
jgi:hypothetical protein